MDSYIYIYFSIHGINPTIQVYHMLKKKTIERFYDLVQFALKSTVYFI